MGFAVGIDLGTSNSVVSVYRRRVPQTIPVEGQAALPSVVSFRDDGGVLVGRAAKSRMLLDPEKTIASVKRCMGDRRKVYRMGHRALSPVNISSIIIKRLAEAARQAEGQEIWDAVITVPAYFTGEQREDTKRAGEEAGLNVLRLVPEPTAAALAYGLDKGKDQTIMVYDLGGGTFDVSILAVKRNDFEVKAVGGDSRLGGDDFDQAIMMWANDRLRAQTGIDLFRDAGREEIIARQRLKEAAEQAKIELSESSSAVISVPECAGHRLELKITLEEYNALIMPMLARTVQCVRAVLGDAGLHACDVDRLILVGGSTKNRLVREVVAREIKEPYVADRVDEVVSHGAAIMAASLFLPEEDNAPVEITSVKVSDVTGHTLGVDMLTNDTKKLVFRPIIPRQTKYPCRRGFLGSTSLPLQTQVNIRVLRGESPDPEQNTHLGAISLPVLQPQEQDIPIGAIFELDPNGIIHFTAVQLPMGPHLEPIVRYAMERGGELDLVAVDALIRSGEAHAKTVCIKYDAE